MQTDGFNKRIYRQLKTSERSLDFSLKVYKLLLKIIFPMENMNGIFASRTRLLCSLEYRLGCSRAFEPLSKLMCGQDISRLESVNKRFWAIISVRVLMLWTPQWEELRSLATSCRRLSRAVWFSWQSLLAGDCCSSSRAMLRFFVGVSPVRIMLLISRSRCGMKWKIV